MEAVMTNLRQRRRGFNMVEVTRAIAVMAIGVAGVMSLFPVGVQASRDAVGDSYAADAADFFLSYLSEEARKNTKWLATQSEGTDSLIQTLPSSIPYTSGGDTSITAIEDTVSTDIDYTSIQQDASKPGLFKMCQGPSSAAILKYSNVALKDFNAAIRVWKSQISNLQIAGSTYTDAIPYNYCVMLHVEVSWPLEKPYSVRQKRYYVMELFNTNPN